MSGRFRHKLWFSFERKRIIVNQPRVCSKCVSKVRIAAEFMRYKRISGQTPGHLTFLKKVGKIPRYVASLEGQMPHPLELPKRVKSPTLQRKQNRLPLEINRIRPTLGP